MHRRLLLLGLLRREDMHGYRLNEFIERDLAFCTDIKKPTAYYLLDRLAEEGHLAERDEGPGGGRPARKTYSITPRGEQRFHELLRVNLRRDDRPTFPVDMSIAFLDQMPRSEALELVQERQRLTEQQLAELRQTPEHGGALQLVIRHHIAHFEAELAWLQQVIGWLEAQEDHGGPDERD